MKNVLICNQKGGVGKTTICNLLTRLYRVKEGKLLLDGININEN